MLNILAIARKELRVYFATMIAYVVIGVFMLLNGYMFVQLVGRYSQFMMQAMQMPQMMDQLSVTYLIAQPLVMNMGVFLIFFIPMLTMRLIAEEKKQRTFELLMTVPVRVWDIVLGKYLAALAVLAIMLLLTLTFPFALDLVNTEGRVIVWKTVASAYAGLFLVGAVFISIGLFWSATTENQLVAGVLALFTLLFLWVISWAASQAEGINKQILEHLSVLSHMQNFGNGLLELKSLVYLLSAAFFGLFLTHKVVEAQRYAGN